jgi:hypothetical protein
MSRRSYTRTEPSQRLRSAPAADLDRRDDRRPGGVDLTRKQAAVVAFLRWAIIRQDLPSANPS